MSPAAFLGMAVYLWGVVVGWRVWVARRFPTVVNFMLAAGFALNGIYWAVLWAVKL